MKTNRRQLLLMTGLVTAPRTISTDFTPTTVAMRDGVKLVANVYRSEDRNLYLDGSVRLADAALA